MDREDVHARDHSIMAVRTYLERIEELVGAPVTIVSVGKARDETVILPRSA